MSRLDIVWLILKENELIYYVIVAYFRIPLIDCKQRIGVYVAMHVIINKLIDYLIKYA